MKVLRCISFPLEWLQAYHGFAMIKLARRTALTGLAMWPLAPSRAQSVDFPDRPLRLVVGFPPGGPNDLLARIIAPGVGERLKRSVVVENRAGANGEIAAASVAKAAPDGGVFMLASNGSTTVAPALSRSVPYDVRTDFAAVAPVGINPMLLVVRKDLPAANVAELLALARAQPGKLNGASAGAGGATHLALELFKSMGHVDIVHVPYKGGGPAMADLMAGLVDIYFGGLSTALPHVKAGKLRALGQTLTVRSAAAPDIPTIAESGLPGYEAAISYGIFLPAGAPTVLVARLHDAVDATVRSPEITRRFTELGADPQFGTPAEFAAYVADDLAKWSRLAKEAGLKVE
jgi:tripartite-type tricarboxylate transporter receptor subunit TctC